MRVEIAIVRREDEASAELKRVLVVIEHSNELAEIVHVLAMAVLLGPLAGGHVIRTKDMECGGGPQSSHAIRYAFRIDEQRKRDARLLAEEVPIVPVAQTDGSNACSLAGELRFMLAQLRDVLAAEDSAVVPQKDHDRRRFGPDRSQPVLIALRIGQRDACEPGTQRIHGPPF